MPRPRSGDAVEVPKLLEKSLRVLEAFDVDTPTRSEVDLSHDLRIPSTTLNRILRALESTGYLMRFEDGRYQLGISAVRLGTRASKALNLSTVLQPILRELNTEVDELILLAVPDFLNGTARYIAAVESSSQVRVIGEVGDSVPLTGGATARTLLAFQPEDRIDEILARPVRRMAAGTLTDPDLIREHLTLLRGRGWGFSWEETFDGAWAVAAPLLDDTGEAFASIGVAAPTGRYSEALEQRARDAVRAAAERATQELGRAPLTPLAVSN